MKPAFLLSTSLAAVLALASCAPNPADDVAKADVTDVTEETAAAPVESTPATQPEPVTPEPAPAPEPKPEPKPTPAPAPAPAPAAAEVASFTLTPDSKLEFVGSKVTGSHTGGFETFTGTFEVDLAEGKLAENGTHTVEIDMNSVFSDNEKLTGHLKSADFFEVETYPTSTFVLTKAVPQDGDNYKLSGTLDLHGVKKAISFPATVTVSEDRKTITVKAEFAINRMDFEIQYPGKPDDLIREEVVIRFDVTGTQA